MLYLFDNPPCKVDCPINGLQRREAERGNRRIGQGEGQMEDLDLKTTYDIIINTFTSTIAECTRFIEKVLTVSDGLSAIKQLWLATKN